MISEISPISSEISPKVTLNMTGPQFNSTPDRVLTFVLFMSEKLKEEWPKNSAHGELIKRERALLRDFKNTHGGFDLHNFLSTESQLVVALLISKGT
jgi:hypothetical protein